MAMKVQLVTVITGTTRTDPEALTDTQYYEAQLLEWTEKELQSAEDGLFSCLVDSVDVMNYVVKHSYWSGP